MAEKYKSQKEIIDLYSAKALQFAERSIVAYFKGRLTHKEAEIELRKMYMDLAEKMVYEVQSFILLKHQESNNNNDTELPDVIKELRGDFIKENNEIQYAFGVDCIELRRIQNRLLTSFSLRREGAQIVFDESIYSSIKQEALQNVTRILKAMTTGSHERNNGEFYEEYSSVIGGQVSHNKYGAGKVIKLVEEQMNRGYENATLPEEEKTLSIVDLVRYQRDKAYKWARDEQKRMGCMAEPINLDCKGIDRPEMVKSYYDNAQCVASLFISSDENATPLFRRDWLDDGGIKYNLLQNYNELIITCPKYTEKLLENGIKIYRHFDGPKGGITKYMPDKPFKY